MIQNAMNNQRPDRLSQTHIPEGITLQQMAQILEPTRSHITDFWKRVKRSSISDYKPFKEDLLQLLAASSLDNSTSLP